MQAGRFTAKEIAKLARTGKLSFFYNSRAWRRISKEVIAEQHGECQFCSARGKYARAELVHHVKPLKRFPALAYEKEYTNAQGERCRQLLACCRECHETIHGRSKKGERRGGSGFENEERW